MAECNAAVSILVINGVLSVECLL